MRMIGMRLWALIFLATISAQTARADLFTAGLYDSQGNACTTNSSTGTRNALDIEVIVGGSVVDPRLVTETNSSSILADLTNGTQKTQLVNSSNANFDMNFGTVGAATLRNACQMGNATGAVDFNAGTTGAQTPRVSANITRNGTELSYNAGTSDANTLRAAVNLKREGNDLDYNFGAASANTLRAAAIPGNASGIADFNAGATGAQTPRTNSNLKIEGTTPDTNFGSASATTLRNACLIGNSTGAATFNVGGVSAQTPRDTLAGDLFFHPIFSLRSQTNAVSTSGNSTTLAVTTTATQSGSLIVVMASSISGTLTITDSASQTYSTATTQTPAGNTYIFYKANSAAGVTSITITTSVASPGTQMNMIMAEYTGIATTTPLDQTSTHSVTGVTSWTSNATSATTQTNEVLIGAALAFAHPNGTWTAGTNWTSVNTVITSGQNLNAFMEDQYVAATGTYAATGTISANDNIDTAIATFKVAANTYPSGFTILNQATVIKSGAGTLKNIIINTSGATGVATFYDNTTNSGTIIAKVDLTSRAVLLYNLSFTNGLTMVVTSSAPDFTVTYD